MSKKWSRESLARGAKCNSLRQLVSISRNDCTFILLIQFSRCSWPNHINGRPNEDLNSLIFSLYVDKVFSLKHIWCTFLLSPVKKVLTHHVYANAYIVMIGKYISISHSSLGKVVKKKYNKEDKGKGDRKETLFKRRGKMLKNYNKKLITETQNSEEICHKGI